MATITETKHGVVIKFTREERNTARSLQNKGEDTVLSTMFYDNQSSIGNNSEWDIHFDSEFHVAIGALTDSPLLSDGIEYNELTDAITGYKEVYWIPDHALRNLTEEIIKKGCIYWEKAP